MIQITERDLRVLREINEFGYVDISYLVRKFKIHQASLYRRLSQLKRCRYLNHMRVFFQEPGAYWLTQQGAALIHSDLSPINQISKATYHHQIAVLHVSYMLSRHLNGDFITERRLRHDSILSGVGVEGHVCDGVLVTANEKIALEVELTQKSKIRLENILQDYCLQVEYNAVWYVCGTSSLYKRFLHLSQEYTMIKPLLLSDVLAGTFDE